MKRRFDDYYYCQTVEEFENKTFSDRFWSAGIQWASIMLFPVLAVGQAVAGSDWRKWVAVLGAAYLLWMVFQFLHEINENIRYVRHQSRVYRDAVREVADMLDQYHSRDNFSLADAVELLDRKWERP